MNISEAKNELFEILSRKYPSLIIACGVRKDAQGDYIHVGVRNTPSKKQSTTIGNEYKNHRVEIEVSGAATAQS